MQIKGKARKYCKAGRGALSMFSEALRILDRNMAELMVDRMKDEIVDLKEQNDELLEEQR